MKFWAKRCVMAMGFAMLAPVTGMTEPSKLLGKAITITGSDTIDAKFSGNTITATVTFERVIYVSSLGRVFSRYTAKSADGAYSEEQTPGGKAEARARAYRVEGNHLVSRQTVNGIYMDAVISFNESFSTCAISEKTTIVGPSRDRKGNKFQVLHMTNSSQSCSVREGNPFAN